MKKKITISEKFYWNVQ